MNIVVLFITFPEVWIF